jgi:hypothetical protein
MTGDCPICAKQSGSGPLSGGAIIAQDELVVATHRPADGVTRRGG